MWVGLWHGGANYSAGGAEDAETFRTIREAADAIRMRRDMGHRYPQPFHYVFRGNQYDLTPCAHDDGSGYVALFRVDRSALLGALFGIPEDAATIREVIESGSPDRLLEIGPRGGIVVHRG